VDGKVYACWAQHRASEPTENPPSPFSNF